MALLQAIYIVVFVFHNFIYCSRIPFILTARDSLTTDATKSLEIVTPVSDVIHEEAISTQRTLFPFEFNSNPTDRTHFPTEIPILLNEKMSTPSSNIKNKTIIETITSKFGQRLPKFIGRLAFLAGLRLADEMSNEASSFNNSSAKENLNPLSLNLTPTKLSPYFAAIYEPFPILSQSIYYNLLVPLLNAMNSQKITNENISNSPQIISSNEHENPTIEEKIIENVTLEKKQRTSISDKMKENITLELLEEENDDNDDDENEDYENTEENEENFDSEESNVDVFVPTSRAPPLKINKSSPPIKSLRQKRPRTTKKPKMKKPTTTTMIPIMDNMTTTNLNNSTNIDNTTQLPIQNNTGYPFNPGYYGGYSQNIHDLYITSSENPQLHEHYNYNEINSHYSDEWPINNRIPHESHVFNQYPPFYDFPPPGEEEYSDHHSFRGSPILQHPSPPNSINNGFKPSVPF